MQLEIQRHLNDLIDDFPTLPTVVTRVMEITADAESSAEALFNVIQADQVMSANVLKMANSVFYGLPKRVGSLQHALSILGYVEIRNLVLTQAVFSSFKHLEKSDVFDLRQFWAHSFSCALAARQVDGRCAVRNQGHYLPCLVHDIGKLLLYMALPEAYAGMVKEAGPVGHKIYELEAHLFGITHAEAGQRLLTHWMLPDLVIHAVGEHHRPEAASEHALDAWVVHVVDLLVHWSDLEDSGDTARARDVLEELLRPEVADRLGAGSNWNAAESAKLRAELADQKELQADLLSLFLV